MGAAEEQAVMAYLKQLHIGIEAVLNGQMSALGLTAAQSHILAYLLKRAENGVPFTGLCKGVGVSKGTASALVKKLCAKGYLICQSSGKDDRKKLVAVTEKGESLQMTLESGMLETCRRLFLGFSEKETLAFLRLHEKMFANLQSWKGSFPGKTAVKEEQKQ